MRSSYYSEYDVFVESAEKIVLHELEPKIDEWEVQGHFPDEIFDLLGSNGLLGILVPEEYGGSGGDYKLAGAWCEVFGELCAVGLTTAVNMHSLVISHALAKYGSTESKKAWLPQAVQGKAIGAYAFTEPGAGSDLANIKT
ncbi:MAG: acyl-CoA dehydrogenase family protein, partial [Deltaproteobacteria bacterium]|nr:acyl-CoA dehydrogenase family protein [Deltaproteobacteria bacterium]